jgi:hypothetical protein
MNEEDRRKKIKEAAMTMLERYWADLQELPPKSFVCGFCEDKVASAQGYTAKPSFGRAPSSAFIYICPSCGSPTFCDERGDLFPKSPPGKLVANVPDDLAALYDEARRSAGAEAFTASVLTCRKILMNIAVDNGADEGESFRDYVQYLDNQGYIPPKGKSWVDYIRTRGNEANHEIALMNQQDATKLVGFVEMLLRFIYEFPSMVP